MNSVWHVSVWLIVLYKASVYIFTEYTTLRRRCVCVFSRVTASILALFSSVQLRFRCKCAHIRQQRTYIHISICSGEFVLLAACRYLLPQSPSSSSLLFLLYLLFAAARLPFQFAQNMNRRLGSVCYSVLPDIHRVVRRFAGLHTQ